VLRLGVNFLSGLARLGDFHHKMRETGGHCALAQPTKQSMFIIITLRSSGGLPAAFRAVTMTIISADHHTSCVSPVFISCHPMILMRDLAASCLLLPLP
jgi:hypothetical protein